MRDYMEAARGGWARALFGVIACWVSGTLLADNLVGKDEIICSSASVVVCLDDGTCVSATPWELNVPQFIEVDLKKKRLATTEASGESRATSVNFLTRESGLTYLQGVEGGRAFSFVINDSTGFMTVAVAREDITVTVFGACTPAD